MKKPSQKIMATIFITIMSTSNLLAGTPWPQSAKNRPLPRKDWILIIPATRNNNGSITIWNKNDKWIKQWRTPKIVDGLKIVPLFGDAEDYRSITGQSIDEMIIQSLEIVQKKYGAPSIGLAVMNQNNIEIAEWVPGWSASWSEINTTNNIENDFIRTIKTISSMQQRTKKTAKQNSMVKNETINEIKLVGYRMRSDGDFDYKITINKFIGEKELKNIKEQLQTQEIEISKNQIDYAEIIVTTSARIEEMKIKVKKLQN